VKVVLNDNEKGDSFVNKSVSLRESKSAKQWVKNTQKSNTFILNKAGVVNISGNPESEGIILKTNKIFISLLGYKDKDELISHSINEIIPNTIATRHVELMKSFIHTGVNRILNKERSLFAICKNGNLIEASLYVQPFPSLNGLEFVGALITKSESDIILTNHSGVIDSMTGGISSKLKIESSQFRHKRVNIRILVPALLDAWESNKEGTWSKINSKIGKRMEIYLPSRFVETFTKHSHHAKDVATEAVFDCEPLYKQYNEKFNKSDEMSTLNAIDLINSKEYREASSLYSAIFHMVEYKFITALNTHPIQIKVIKLSKIEKKKDATITLKKKKTAPSKFKKGGEESDADGLSLKSGVAKSVKPLSSSDEEKPSNDDIKRQTIISNDNDSKKDMLSFEDIAPRRSMIQLNDEATHEEKSMKKRNKNDNSTYRENNEEEVHLINKKVIEEDVGSQFSGSTGSTVRVAISLRKAIEERSYPKSILTLIITSVIEIIVGMCIICMLLN
jgi:PAS domain S-box-containing protein